MPTRLYTSLYQYNMYQTSSNHKILSVVVIYLEADTGQRKILLTEEQRASIMIALIITACTDTPTHSLQKMDCCFNVT